MKSILSVSIICLCFLFSCKTENKKLPILGNRELVEKNLNGEKVTDTIYQNIPKFSFLNQDSVLVSDETIGGKIYVADFFFTSCTSICPIMSKNMLKVYQKYKDNDDVLILSHTIDPKHDSISVLKKYATKLGVNSDKWHFLHGPKDVVYELAKTAYLSYAQEDKTIPDGIAHSGYFILVDSKKHIRGAYDGTDAKQVEKLLVDMDILLAEESERDEE